MKASKISSDKNKTCRVPVINQSNKTKKSSSIEGLNTKNSAKKNTKLKNSESSPNETDQFLQDRDLAELAFTEEFGTVFEKFWKSVTDGIDKQPVQEPARKVTAIDKKISDIKRRINLNQAVLKSANERMKGITFASERQNLSRWKENFAYSNHSAKEDLNRFKDVKALDLEIQKLKDSKPDRNVILKSSPGIVNFHETMESTLNMLDKIQNGDELDDDNGYRDIKNEFNLDFIKTPNLVAISDEE